MMKIKNFKCDRINPEGLQQVENEVNEFLSSHDIIDIKITSCCNSFGTLLLYAVLYNG